MKREQAQIGAKAKFSTSQSDMSIVTYSARIVKIESDGYWVEIPPRVRNLPFPPVAGKRYAKYAFV